jgi:hypothetical protein
VEKPQSPAAKEIPSFVQEYPRRIEQAWPEYQQLKEIEFPGEAVQGQGELEMIDDSSNLVQKQLSELVQQVVHMVPAGNVEIEILEDEF